MDWVHKWTESEGEGGRCDGWMNGEFIYSLNNWSVLSTGLNTHTHSQITCPASLRYRDDVSEGVSSLVRVRPSVHHHPDWLTRISFSFHVFSSPNFCCTNTKQWMVHQRNFPITLIVCRETKMRKRGVGGSEFRNILELIIIFRSCFNFREFKFPH